MTNTAEILDRRDAARATELRYAKTPGHLSLILATRGCGPVMVHTLTGWQPLDLLPENLHGAILTERDRLDHKIATLRRFYPCMVIGHQTAVSFASKRATALTNLSNQ